MGKTAQKESIHIPEPGNEAPAANESEIPVSIRLSLSQELYAEYQQAAGSMGLTVTELIMHRLRHCREHNSIRPLYFTDIQRAVLETLLQKRPLSDAEHVLTLLTTALSVRIEGFPPIQLTAQQIKRIGMAGYAGQSAEERLTQIVKGAISKAVGI